MLGTITTIAVIALGQALVRPSSKDSGWLLASNGPALHQMEKLSTDQQIVTAFVAGTATTGASFASKDRAISRLEWLRAELLSYQDLPVGWDGEGSIPAKPEHIAAASSLLEAIPAGIPLPKPMLSPDGELGLYWKSDRWFADAVIEDANHFSLFVRSLEEGNHEVFVDSINIGADTSDAIKNAFAAV